jgi:hypothetical protein
LPFCSSGGRALLEKPEGCGEMGIEEEDFLGGVAGGGDVMEDEGDGMVAYWISERKSGLL